MSESKSQSEIILEHMRSGKSITPAEAYELCGTLALHSRIAELRKRGYPIRKVMMEAGGKRFGSYSLEAR